MAWFRAMGADSVDYHRRTVLGREDDYPGRALAYYASRGETPLRWGGRLAARLGLSGDVSDHDYAAVFGPGGARDPHLGRRLVHTRRPGVEVVVAPPKSVAVLGLIGRAEDMHAILDAETDGTVRFLEECMARQGGRRGRAQVRTATGGLLYAATRHGFSRDADPYPHDHVLVANVTEMCDALGGHKGLDTAWVRDLLHAATMVGRLAGAARAVELGYAIEADRGPSGRLDHWRIAGIPEQVCRHFSKRAAEIEAHTERSGFDSYRAKAVATRATRAAKPHHAMESLMARWHDELAAMGWPARKLNQRLGVVNERHHRPVSELNEVEVAERAAGLVGPGGPLAKAKAFTRADVIRHAAPALYGRRPEELDRVVSAVISHPQAIPLVGQPAARERAWAAASVLATEVAVEEVAGRLGADRTRAAVAPEVVTRAVAAKEAALGARLTDGQRRAAEAIATSGRGLDVVVGVAGSGKTTALEVARTAFEAQGYRVLGTAVSGQASRALQRGAGVDSRTVASLVWRLEHGALRLDDRTVVLIDEAGTADDAAMLRLLAAVESGGAKAVVIGDHLQLGSVDPGGGLEALVRRHLPAVQVLEENVRQELPAERVALEELRAGSVPKAVAWYRRNHRIVAGPTRDQVLARAVDAWESDRRRGCDTVLLAWRRRDVAALNQLARQRMVAAGVVGGPEVQLEGGRPFAAGDEVVTLAPSGDGRYVTSQRATVLGVVGDALEVAFDDGGREVLAGEELGAGRLDHAYALTVHRVQGATVQRAHVFADGGGRELAYVAMSRATRATHAYVVADDVDQAVDDLVAEWGVSRRRRWVIDDAPAADGTMRRPYQSPRPTEAVSAARLRAEHDAVVAVAPWAEERLRVLRMQVRLHEMDGREPPRRSRALSL